MLLENGGRRHLMHDHLTSLRIRYYVLNVHVRVHIDFAARFRMGILLPSLFIIGQLSSLLLRLLLLHLVLRLTLVANNSDSNHLIILLGNLGLVDLRLDLVGFVGI